MSLGEFIKKRRKAKKLTLQQVAAMAGTSKSHIWELENGRTPNPGFLNCIYIAFAVGASMDEMAIAACDGVRDAKLGLGKKQEVKS